MEAIRTSEKSVLTRTTRCHIPRDGKSKTVFMVRCENSFGALCVPQAASQKELAIVSKLHYFRNIEQFIYVTHIF
jgi:hypothetical protein